MTKVETSRMERPPGHSQHQLNNSGEEQVNSNSTQDSEDAPTAESLDGWLVLVDGEKARDVWFQSMIPFLMAGFGSIGAGLLVHFAQTTYLVRAVPQFLSVAPPIQGMKGNLDLTLTSRLTTMAHRGRLQPGKILNIFVRNIALVQAQSITLSVFMNIFCFALDLVKRIPFGCPAPVREFILLGAVTIVTMFVSGLLMSSTMILIILYSTKRKINPDNIATPLSASLGDFLTIISLISLGALIFSLGSHRMIYAGIIIVIALLSIPFFLNIASKDDSSLLAAKTQWPSLVLAAMFSSGAGFVQEHAFRIYPEFTVYLPLIAGICGNRAALHASRISSFLMVKSHNPIKFKIRLNPFKYYLHNDNESQAARLLLFTCIPFQLVFLLTSHGLSEVVGTPLTLKWPFLLGYILIVFLQVAVLLYICQLVVTLLWSRGIDPDLHSIPIITSIGDLIATFLLAGLYWFFASTAADVVHTDDHFRSNYTCTTM